MKQLQHFRIGEQLLEMGRALLSRRNLDEVGAAVAARQLHQAQPIAADLEAERFGVDRDDGAEIVIGRQVAGMEADRHGVWRSVARFAATTRKALINFIFSAHAPVRMISRRLLERQANRGRSARGRQKRSHPLAVAREREAKVWGGAFCNARGMSRSAEPLIRNCSTRVARLGRSCGQRVPGRRRLFDHRRVLLRRLSIFPTAC